ncbi:MAG: peroxiredoxin [Synechococcales cyanobacterium C42_A2020_086]|nr:peroxiredoxin [Synechococcales cyanobacterium C42_A2020_086]
MNLSRRTLLKTFLKGLYLWGLLLAISLSATAPALALGGPQPPLNQPAPDFTLPTNSGDGTISLSDYRGQWVVVYFYPKDFTPGCTLEARRFQQDLPKYIARNTQIIGISADDVDSHEEFCDSEGLKFPLLADVDGTVSQAYGSWLGYASLRHTYIIDPAGILRERFLGVKPAVHSQEVLSKLAELQSAS